MTARKAASSGVGAQEQAGQKMPGPKVVAKKVVKKSVPEAKASALVGAPKEKKAGQKPTRTAEAVVRAMAGQSQDGRTGEVAFNQIEKEAYLLAEKDGFRDDPVRYWLAAEVQLGLRPA